MATTQPTPPPNLATDSEETPPITNQQTQEPVDPLTTRDSPGIDSEGIGTELGVTVPTTSETATDQPAILRPSEPSLIVGSATAVIVVIILTILTVVIVVAVLLKKHEKTKKKEGYSVKNVAAVPTTTNQAYGLTHHSESGVEESIYNYPEVDLDTIEAKQNEAYVKNTDIVTEGNQAYATNIATEINSAYGPVEITNEYDYI